MIDPSDVLDTLMVRRNAAPDQAEWSRKPVEHVNLDMQIRLLQQIIGCIEGGGTGANDGDAEWLICGARCFHRG